MIPVSHSLKNGSEPLFIVCWKNNRRHDKKDAENVDTNVITIINIETAKIFFSQLSLKDSSTNPMIEATKG